MGIQLILKDENTIVVWSTIVDDFIFEGPIEDFILIEIEERATEIRNRLISIYNRLKKGENVYYQFQMTYEEACNYSKNPVD